MNDFLENKFNELIRGKSSSRSAAKGNGRFAVATSIGLVRNRNEDRCALLRARFGGNPGRDFNAGIVCDGLGGMESGEEAATAAAAAFLSILAQRRIGHPLETLRWAIIEANNRVHASLGGRGGTTLTAAVVTRHQGTFFCHAGDSRLFLIGPERTVNQLTRDDTMASLLGKSLPEGERDNRLVQFVGVGDEIEPQVAAVDQLGGTLLLTSDGAHDVPASIFKKVVSAAASPADLAKRLTQLSDILGGVDNSTVVVMPNYLEDEALAGIGAELRLTIPSDEFTFLLSSYSDASTPPPAAKVAIADEPKPQATRRRAPKAKVKDGDHSKSKKRSSKKARSGELPLEEPGVNVEFPDQSKGAE